MATATAPKPAPKTTGTKKQKADHPKSKAGQTEKRTEKQPERIELAVDKKALKKLKLVAVAYSDVKREMFATDDAYKAEVEVEGRAQEVIKCSWT